MSNNARDSDKLRGAPQPICSKCHAPRERGSQRYCRECHATYMRKWRLSVRARRLHAIVERVSRVSHETGTAA